jgi:VanZ family protein
MQDKRGYGRHHVKPLMMLSQWLPPIMWSGVILFIAGDLGSAVYTWHLIAELQDYFPLLQSVPTSKLNHIARVVGHILAYGLLMVLWLRACRWQWPMHPVGVILLSLVATFLVAVLDELRQSRYPSRRGDFADVILDMSGGLTAALFLYFWVFRSLKK